MYPLIMIVVAVIAVAVMLWLVVPTFASMFKDMGAELPAITQFVVDASNNLIQYGHYGLIVVVATTIGFKRFLSTETGRRYVGGILMVLPTVGQLMVEMAMYRFASNLALLLKSGVPLMETMRTVKGVFQNNPIYRDALEHVTARIAAGRPLHACLRETKLFLPMLISMVQVGEESGQLALVMEQIAPFYKEKMEGMILKVTKMLEPLIIMVMGVDDRGGDAGDLHADVRDGGQGEVILPCQGVAPYEIENCATPQALQWADFLPEIPFMTDQPERKNSDEVTYLVVAIGIPPTPGLLWKGRLFPRRDDGCHDHIGSAVLHGDPSVPEFAGTIAGGRRRGESAEHLVGAASVLAREPHFFA